MPFLAQFFQVSPSLLPHNNTQDLHGYPGIRIHTIFQSKELLAKNIFVQIIKLHGILAFGFTLTRWLLKTFDQKKKGPHIQLCIIRFLFIRYFQIWKILKSLTFCSKLFNYQKKSQ